MISNRYLNQGGARFVCVNHTMRGFLPQLSLTVLVARFCAGSLGPTPVSKGSIDAVTSQFITVQNGEFFVNGRYPLNYLQCCGLLC